MTFDYNAAFKGIFESFGIKTTSASGGGINAVKSLIAAKAEKTEGEDELQSVAIEPADTGNEEADEAIDKINEQLQETEENYQKQIKQCYQQIQTLQNQLSSISKQEQTMSYQAYGGSTGAEQINQTLMSIAEQKNEIYDKIDMMLLNISELEEALAEAQEKAQKSIDDIMEQIAQMGDNAPAAVTAIGDVQLAQPSEVKLSTSNAISTSSISNTGNGAVNTALKYDDKSASEMKDIMKNAGAKYHDGAWCADFVSFAIQETYGKDNSPGNFLNSCPNTSSCQTIKNWASSNDCWTTNLNNVKSGDIVVYDWDGDGHADHVGLFASSNGASSINTVEGNTSGAAGKSCVEAKKRSTGKVLGYVTLSQFQ